MRNFILNIFRTFPSRNARRVLDFFQREYEVKIVLGILNEGRQIVIIMILIAKISFTSIKIDGLCYCRNNVVVRNLISDSKDIITRKSLRDYKERITLRNNRGRKNRCGISRKNSTSCISCRFCP